MRSIKLKVSKLWIPFIVLGIYTNTWKVMIAIFCMLAIHEIMHIVVAQIFRYTINEVIVYPFGLGAKIEHIGHGNVWHEIAIILAGPATHLIFPFIFSLLLSVDVISSSFYEYLLLMNRNMLIFNILPIFPLDGGRLMQSFFHLFFRFKMAELLTFIASFINLYLVITRNVLTGSSGIVILFFLGFQIMMGLMQLPLSMMQFYLYRKRHPVKHKIKANDSLDFFRNKTNMILYRGSWILEQDYLNYIYQVPQNANKKRRNPLLL